MATAGSNEEEEDSACALGSPREAPGGAGTWTAARLLGACRGPYVANVRAGVAAHSRESGFPVG